MEVIKPITWPFWHVAAALKATKPHNPKAGGKKDDVPIPQANSVLTVSEHTSSCLAAFRSFLMALACIYWIHGGSGETDGYPAFGRGRVLAWSWMWPIIVRNLVATWLIAGFWDWFLYFSPVAPSLKRFKYNPVTPSLAQFGHDALFTTSSTLCGTAIEIGLCHLWARGVVPMQKQVDWFTILQGFTLLYVRVPHFHFVHRVMHPWKIRNLPKRLDPGSFLYRHVHSLHHKSYNPTAFSGTSMHPIEGFLYYTAALMPVALFSCHPSVALAYLVDCGVGAWLGHDGFQWPGSGDYFHQLHHSNFDCNYGAQHVPLDKWFGTFAACKEDVKKIWAGTEPSKK